MTYTPTRRTFLTTAGAAMVSTWTRPGLAALAAKPKTLTAEPGAIPLIGGRYPDTQVWTYNGGVPGPELRFKQNDNLKINFVNKLPDPTTVHWHGLRLPNAMDGVPDLTQPPVKPGGSFDYAFGLPDAGTYWYHPHVKSSEQVGRGLYGPLIIEEADPPRVDREVTWVIDDWRLGQDGQIAGDFNDMRDMSHGGRMGNLMTLNGRDSQRFPVRAGERLRLRIINVANARIFGLRFDGHHPTIIAMDGHPVAPHVPHQNRVTLGPGQRADLIIDMEGRPGDLTAVVDDNSGRRKYVYLEFDYSAEAPLRTSPLDAPKALAANPLPGLDIANAETHALSIAGGAMGGMTGAKYKGRDMDIRSLAQEHGKVWALNGITFHGMDAAPLFRFQKGRTQVMTLRNDTSWPHPMHLHGHVFKILERGGKPDPVQPWTDTILLAPNEVSKIAFVADNPGKWLFHCHILGHTQAGMACVTEVA